MVSDMNLEKRIANYFRLRRQEDWLRHANPWSVATRFIILPFLILVIWSRIWIGWYSLIFIILLIIWSLVNPKLFHRYTKINNWWSKSVIGEYFWINRDDIPVPKYHYKIIKILTFLQTVGGIILILGLYKLDMLLTFIGTISIYFSKMWFLDRMVWIYENMKDNPSYREFLDEISR